MQVPHSEENATNNRPPQHLLLWAYKVHDALEAVLDPRVPEDLRDDAALCVAAELLALPADKDLLPSVWLALEEVQRVSPIICELEERLRDLAKSVKRLHRTAVLGPGWRRRQDKVEVSLREELHPGRQIDPLYRAEIDLLRRVTPPQEGRMLALLRDEPALYNDREELARRLGITQNNVRQILYRIRAIALAM